MSKKQKKKAQTSKAAPAAAAAPQKNSQILPSKEQNHWKRVLKHYERKEYKKVIKAADMILKNFPNHGETLAMKGLTMNCLKRKDEARKLVKMGVMNNLKSHVCWHVYGLLYRSDHMYDDAIKCYQNALMHDKDNSQILKDLANLQIQRRELQGFQETRRKLLLQKKNNRSNWIAYGIGAHLCGQYKKSIKILDSFIKSQKEVDDRTSNYEVSEIHIYKNIVMTESGNTEGAIAHLDEVESKIVDKIYVHERKGELLLKAGKKDEAETQYRKLLAINCENYNYHYGLIQSLGLATDGIFDNLTDEARGQLTELYKSLTTEFGDKVSSIIRIPLGFLAGSSFVDAVGEYMRDRLRKGIPSLFRDLKNLYIDPEKIKTITDLVTGYIASLRSDQRFSSKEEAGSESPVVLVWALYYAAHHYDHLADYAKALAAVNEALDHTPTNIDLYVLKARILKHSGDVELAHDYMEEARKLDTADRYLNTKCVRYALRADKIDVANDVVSLFLRDGDNLISLFDMQCCWFELQCGHSYSRQKDFGRALKQYTSVVKHFQDMEDDQFDFHSYCLKKLTLKAYVGMIRMEDKIRSHRFFFKACQGAVQTYLDMYDSRQVLVKEEEKQAAAQVDLSPAEKKQIAKKKKREAAKAARLAEEQKKQEEELEKEEKKAEKKKENNRNKEVDSDPHGAELAKTEDPLSDAVKYLADFLKFSNDCIESHILAMEVYSRKNKPLLVLRSLIKALTLNKSHPDIHLLHFSFLQKVEEEKAKLHPTVIKIIESERAAGTIGGGFSSVKELNDAFLKEFSSSLAHRTAAAKCSLLVGTKAEAAFAFTKDVPLESASVKDCCSLLATLVKAGQDATAFKTRCLKRFPLTPAFMDTKVYKAHQEQEKIKEPI